MVVFRENVFHVFVNGQNMEEKTPGISDGLHFTYNMGEFRQWRERREWRQHLFTFAIDFGMYLDDVTHGKKIHHFYHDEIRNFLTNVDDTPPAPHPTDTKI
jgi:hypothetical protein